MRAVVSGLWEGDVGGGWRGRGQGGTRMQIQIHLHMDMYVQMSSLNAETSQQIPQVLRWDMYVAGIYFNVLCAQ